MLCCNVRLRQITKCGQITASVSRQRSGGSDKLRLQWTRGHRPTKCSVPAHRFQFSSAAECEGRLLFLPAGEVSIGSTPFHS